MKSSQCDLWLALTTTHYYFMAFERGVCGVAHTLMSVLSLMLCSTQRPLLHAACHPSLEFTNTSKCINSTEEKEIESKSAQRVDSTQTPYI